MLLERRQSRLINRSYPTTEDVFRKTLTFIG
jgi:hypothetical protein